MSTISYRRLPIGTAEILDVNGARLAIALEERHAVSIVRRCNSHDALVAALCDLGEFIRREEIALPADLLEQCDAALAAAGAAP